MSGNKFIGKDEIIQKLIMLDKEIYLEFDNDDIYEITIVGGSALILIDKSTRFTTDIDTISCSAELKPYMKHYDINSMVLAYQSNFSPDFDERRQKLDIDTKKIIIYTVSLEDLIISKLPSNRPQDQEDIRNPKVIEAIDWDKLDSIINSDEFKFNMTDHNYKMFMCDYRDYKEEVQNQ